MTRASLNETYFLRLKFLEVDSSMFKGWKTQIIGCQMFFYLHHVRSILRTCV